ncbi:unnamed protein product [Discula destructiva]
MELDSVYDVYDYPVADPEGCEGHIGHLTSAQQAKLQDLRSALAQEGYTSRLDTLTLLRFLRARSFDLDASKKMWVETEQWRKDFKLDAIIPTWEFPEKNEVFKYYAQYYHQTDKDGRPVYIEHISNMDLTSIYKLTTPDRLLTNFVVEQERLSQTRLPACSRKKGVLVDTVCTIIDISGVSIRQVPGVYSHIRRVSDVTQNNYPERLGHTYIINAPWGFGTVWNVIKAWLDAVTREKIHVLGSAYQQELLAQVPAENLPKRYGGTCDCEAGCEFSDAGPWQQPQWVSPEKTATKSPLAPAEA